jgi:hypothetical protein
MGQIGNAAFRPHKAVVPSGVAAPAAAPQPVVLRPANPRWAMSLKNKLGHVTLVNPPGPPASGVSSIIPRVLHPHRVFTLPRKGTA